MKLGSKSLLLSLSLGAFLLGALTTYFTFPKKQIEIKTETVEKVVFRDKVVDKTKVTTKKPDGTVIVVEKDITKDRDVTQDVKISEKLKLLERPSQPSWGIGAYALVEPLNPLRGPVYGGFVEKRLVGPFWLGLYGQSNGFFGGGISVRW